MIKKMIGLKKNFLIAHLYYAKLHFGQIQDSNSSKFINFHRLKINT